MKALAAALGALAPGSRSSGLFNDASLQPGGPVLGSTPMPAVPTLDPAGPTRRDARTEPLTQPPFSELPAQETMRGWNTTAIPRTGAKKVSRVPHVALGVGIAIAAATLVGVLIDNRPGELVQRARGGDGLRPTLDVRQRRIRHRAAVNRARDVRGRGRRNCPAAPQLAGQPRLGAPLVVRVVRVGAAAGTAEAPTELQSTVYGGQKRDPACQTLVQPLAPPRR